MRVHAHAYNLILLIFIYAHDFKYVYIYNIYAYSHFKISNNSTDDRNVSIGAFLQVKQGVMSYEVELINCENIYLLRV